MAELEEGAVSRHKEMPQIVFSEEDTYAIMFYLSAITRSDRLKARGSR
jgi:hypothetical protein